MLSRISDAMNKTKICKDTQKWVNHNVSNTTNHIKKNFNNVLNGSYWKESNNANINELNYSIVEDNKKLYKIYIELPGVLSESINMSFYMHDLIITAIKPTPSGIKICNLPSESHFDEESSTGPSGSSPLSSSSDSSHNNCDKQDKKITGNMKYGSIHSIIQLPVIVTSHNNIQYVYVNGILKITIPMIAVQDPVVIKYKKRSKVV